MRKKHSEELNAEKAEGSFGINGDEMTECAIYDATCLRERTDTTFKKQRKVFKDTPIRVRFLLRNPLLADISISRLRLVCRYLDSSDDEAGKQL